MSEESNGNESLIQLTPEQHIEARKLYYESVQAQLKHVMDMQGAQGRWLIASLLLIHGGIFAFLAQSERLSVLVLPHVFIWLAVGIIFALACGFATWWNWSFTANIYAGIQPWMIYDGSVIKFADWERNMVRATMWLAIIFGLVSAFCIGGVAWTGYQLVHYTAHATSA